MKARTACRIVTTDCYWLSFPTERLQNRENFFLNQFELTRPELNSVVTEYSRVSSEYAYGLPVRLLLLLVLTDALYLFVILIQVITWSLRGMVLLKMSLMEDMRFSFDQVKNMLLYKPRLFCHNKYHILSRYKILREQMGLSCEELAACPRVQDAFLYICLYRAIYSNA